MTHRKFFLTGATGFVGSHVAERLSQLRIPFVCAIRPGRRDLSWVTPLSPEVDIVDLTDTAALSRSLQNIDTVIHVAGVTKARTNEGYVEGNVRTTAALIDAARAAGVRRFCYVSSLTAVGPNPNGLPVDEQTVCHPITAYGRSKREAELRVLAASADLEVTILRPPAVYGPRDRDVFEFFKWASRGLKPVLGDTNARMSIIHVEDLANAIVHCSLHTKVREEVFLVSDPHEYSYDEIFQFLGKAARRNLRTVRIPEPVLRVAAWCAEVISSAINHPLPLNREKLRDLLQPYWTCSSSRISNLTGYHSRIDGETGFVTTYRWYLEQGWIH